MGAGTKIREAVSYSSSPGPFGSLITEVIVWLHGLCSGNSGPTSSKSDSEIVCRLSRLDMLDNGLFLQLLQIWVRALFLYMVWPLSVFCLSLIYIQVRGSRSVRRLAQVHTAC